MKVRSVSPSLRPL